MATAKRYRYLTDYIAKFKPETILEVGTWDGNHAALMIKKALEFQKFVHYYGFDLFQDITDEQIITEKSKCRVTYADVSSRLETIPNSTVQLIRGNTHDTLAKFKPIYPIDFIFIDGGHSLDTVENDFFWCQQLMQPKKTVMLLDDYYPDNSLIGCRRLIDGLNREKYDVKVLPLMDEFKQPTGTLKIHFARVIIL